MRRLRKMTSKSVLLAIALIIVMTSAVIFEQNAIASQLNDWKLIPQAERVTELYFTNPKSIPTTYSPDSSDTITFTVHNLERRYTTYSYVVTQHGKQGSNQMLGHGNSTLGQDDKATIKVPVTYGDTGNSTEIVVTIHYQGIDLGKDKPSNQTQAIYMLLKKNEVVL